MTGGKGFIAVQCAQCSTMQVKQQPKQQMKQTRRGGGFAVSKWTCAVCNLKQSVVRVFARGPMARDLRRFIQEFNMARESAAEAAACLAVVDEEGQEKPDNGYEGWDALDDDVEVSPYRKRSDWSEYLDDTSIPAADDGGDAEIHLLGEGSEIAIVTEPTLPKTRSNLRIGNGREGPRPLKRNRRCEPDHQQDNGRSICASFAERGSSGKVANTPRWSEHSALASSHLAEGDRFQSPRGLADGTSRSFWNRSVPSCSDGRASCFGAGAAAEAVKAGAAASKWSAYLHHDEDQQDPAGDNKDLPFQRSSSFRDGPGNNYVRPGSSGDVAVEEEIHPDFM